jgi:hypothetical protein
MTRKLWPLVVACLLLAPEAAQAQASFDAQSSGQCTQDTCASSTTLTISHTTGSGSNRAMAVGVFAACAGGDTVPAVSTVTYAGSQSLSEIQSENPATNRRGYLYALPAGTQPTSGANSLVVVLASNLGAACSTSNGVLSAVILTASGVNQTTTFTSSIDGSGSGTTASLTLSSSGANDLGVHFVCAGGGITSTTETERGPKIDNTINTCASVHSATAAGGDTAFSWTIPSDSWIMAGGALKEASAAAATPKLTLLGVGE